MLECVKEVFSHETDDPCAREILDIEEEIGMSIVNRRLKEVYRQIHHAVVIKVLEAKREFSSLDQMPQHQSWFPLPPYINDSWQSKAPNMVRAGNFKLGNRMANMHGKQWKEWSVHGA